jgi:hypothetical protein
MKGYFDKVSNLSIVSFSWFFFLTICRLTVSRFMRAPLNHFSQNEQAGRQHLLPLPCKDISGLSFR